jgi:hypothetical protein
VLLFFAFVVLTFVFSQQDEKEGVVDQKLLLLLFVISSTLFIFRSAYGTFNAVELFAIACLFVSYPFLSKFFGGADLKFFIFFILAFGLVNFGFFMVCFLFMLLIKAFIFKKESFNVGYGMFYSLIGFLFIRIFVGA